MSYHIGAGVKSCFVVLAEIVVNSREGVALGVEFVQTAVELLR